MQDDTTLMLLKQIISKASQFLPRFTGWLSRMTSSCNLFLFMYRYFNQWETPAHQFEAYLCKLKKKVPALQGIVKTRQERFCLQPIVRFQVHELKANLCACTQWWLFGFSKAVGLFGFRNNTIQVQQSYFISTSKKRIKKHRSIETSQ